MPRSGLEGGRVLLVYDGGALAGDLASRDVVAQLEAVEAALESLGCATARLAIGLNLDAFKAALRRKKPDLVFNLVESLDGSDRLQTVAALLLESWGLPFTGSGSAALLLANHKILAKRFLARRGLPVPDCAWLERGKLSFFPPPGAAGRGDWLLKAVESHASLHIDDSSLLRRAGPAELSRRLSELERRHGQAFFAERFVEGREFNLGLVENAAGRPEVLPAAEMDFSGLPPDRPRIVGYAAKWEEASAEYAATPRVFALGPGGARLTRRLSAMAADTWLALGLAGYARVDFRLDAEGRAFVLEANANPCLSPDAGLAAAAARMGLAFSGLVRRLALAGLARAGKSPGREKKK
jgi:D-alanine-D-alanine ligase